MMNHTEIDTVELGKNLAICRASTGESLDDIADMTGVSKSTLSRIERGKGQPDFRVVAAIMDYLNIPIGRVIGGSKEDPVVYYPTEPTPDIVRAHLMNDKTLTPSRAEALSELFRIAYQQFSNAERPATTR